MAETEKVMDSKAMLKQASKEGRKIKRTDRIQLEILKDTKYYKKGMVITPHPVLGEELIKNKVAKKVTKEE